MTLTPQEIQSKQFHVRFRGFDVEEVDGFLEEIAEAQLMLLEENKTLSERLEVMEREVETYKGSANTFQNAIISAQRIADEIQTKSREEAEALVNQAKDKAENIMARTKKAIRQLHDEAHAEVSNLEAGVEELRGLKAKITEDLRNLLTSYLEGLDRGLPERAESRPAKAAKSEEPKISRALTKRGLVEEEEHRELYEKIDLPNELGFESALQARQPQPRAREVEPSPASEGLLERSWHDEEPEVESKGLPDLDGEMMFNIDDPLDQESDHEMSLDFNHDHHDERKK